MQYTDTYSKQASRTVVVKPYKSWGMFTTRGNKRISELAQRLMDGVERSSSIVDKLVHFDKFFKATYKLDNYKSYREAGDTDWGVAPGGGPPDERLCSSAWLACRSRTISASPIGEG